jgi:hypothetical protein
MEWPKIIFKKAELLVAKELYGKRKMLAVVVWCGMS